MLILLRQVHFYTQMQNLGLLYANKSIFIFISYRHILQAGAEEIKTGYAMFSAQ